MNIEKTNANVTKVICDKSIDISMVNGKNLEVLPLRFGTRQLCWLSPLLFSRVLKDLDRDCKQEKEFKGRKIRKKRVR